MLGTSALYSSPKSNPLTKESSMSSQADDSHWAVIDTTEGNWTAHPDTTGFGPLGHSACQGLLIHSTLAFTPERVPLGLVAQQVWARDPDDIGKRARRKQLPISQKESQKWLASLDAVFSARDACPQTCFVSIGDREADVYDLLATPRPA